LVVSKTFTAQVFRWLYQVNGDHGLPASAAKVAIYLAPHFNEAEGGMAWPSCKTISDAIGKSEATVINVIRWLGDRGHLRIEWGKQGRGHSNRYWMIEKDQQADLFEDTKPQPAKVFKAEKTLVFTAAKPQPTKIKPQLSELKPWPAKETLTKTHLRTIEGKKRASRTRARPPDFASREGSKEESADEKKNRAAAIADGFARFWSSYLRKVSEDDARAAFTKAIEAGAEIETVVARAAAYSVERAEAIRDGDNPKWTLHPATWLKKRKFNDPPASAAGGPPVIDGVTGEEIPQAPAPRRNSGSWTAVADEMIRTGFFEKTGMWPKPNGGART
jgi:Helix-turn-helix domain